MVAGDQETLDDGLDEGSGRQRRRGGARTGAERRAATRLRTRLRPLSSSTAGIVSVAVGAALLLTALAGSISVFLMTLGLAGVILGLFVAFSGRAFWPRVLNSRKAGAFTAGVALVTLFAGSGMAEMPPAPEAPARHGVVAGSTMAPPSPSEAGSLAVIDVTAGPASVATESLESSGFKVSYRTSGGESITDYGAWLVTEQSPAAGRMVRRGSTVTLMLSARTAAPTAPPVPAPAPTPLPVPTLRSGAAPHGSTPALATPKPVVTKPVPTKPVPSPGPSVRPTSGPAPRQIVPGGFCPAASVGSTVVAAHGRSYVCGGTGPDGKGHSHWNPVH